MKTKVETPMVAPTHHETGFYYHYKHKPTDDPFEYAYLIMGAGLHSESEIDPDDQFMQVYLPLYESLVYRMGKLFDLRPNAMAMEDVEVDGVKVPRFSRITDAALIAQLKVRAREMYPAIAGCFAL